MTEMVLDPRVEVRGCKDLDDQQVQWCSHDDADYYGVYITHTNGMTWIADFASYADALNWGEEVAENNEVKFFDMTFDEDNQEIH